MDIESNGNSDLFSLPEMQESWDDVMGQMLSFVNDTNADIDMAYDFVCEQLGISSFVDNEKAWDDFYTYRILKQQTIATKPNTTSPDN